MEAFLTVTVFLFLPALYPWFMHPKTRRRPEGKWILLGMGAVAAGIAAVGYSGVQVMMALDAIALFAWWSLLLVWSITATVARVRYRRQRRIADRLRAQFDRGPGVSQ